MNIKQLEKRIVFAGLKKVFLYGAVLAVWIILFQFSPRLGNYASLIVSVTTLLLIMGLAVAGDFEPTTEPVSFHETIQNIRIQNPKDFHDKLDQVIIALEEVRTEFQRIGLISAADAITFELYYLKLEKRERDLKREAA